MFSLIALLSCQGLFPASDAATSGGGGGSTMTSGNVPEVPAARPVAMPRTPLVTRQCFAAEREEARSRAVPPPAPPASAPMGGYGSGGASGMTPATTATGSAPSAKPSAAQSTASSGPTAARATSSKGAANSPAKSQPAPLADAAASGVDASNAVASAPMDAFNEQGDAGMGTVGGGAEGQTAGRGASEESVGKMAEKKKDESPMARPAEPIAPNVDWGATIYLSNDDSMSLASAQRLLWAVQNRGPVATSQVRPHEFLNYFSFDTLPVEDGHHFSVNAAAEPGAADTLTMAFAVKGMVPERQPLDLTLVLDRSGSMSAEGRMEYLKRGLLQMTEQLQRGDRVDMVLFDDQLCTPIESFVVGRDDPSVLTGVIRQLQPRGSTDLDSGLQEGYRIANARVGTDVAGRNRRMMLISDALLNTGDIDPNTVSEVGRAYEQSGVRLTAIGVGRDFNDKILDMLSEKGKGAYVYLGSEAVVDRVFGLGFRSLTETIAHDVRFALDLPPSLAMERFYGEESSTNPEDVQPINYYAGTTQLFLQDLKVRGTPVRSDLVKLTIEYTDPTSGKRATEAFSATVGELLDSDARNLRKGQALIAWTDLILARSMRGNPCGAPFSNWQDRVDALGADAEIQWLDGLTSPLCGASPRVPQPPVASGVPYKVKIDSDLPIAEVTMSCGGWHDTAALSSGSNVAKFNPRPGACTLTLQGTVPMVANVDVPATGADIRCVVRGGRLSCG